MAQKTGNESIPALYPIYTKKKELNHVISNVTSLYRNMSFENEVALAGEYSRLSKLLIQVASGRVQHCYINIFQLYWYLLSSLLSHIHLIAQRSILLSLLLTRKWKSLKSYTIFTSTLISPTSPQRPSPLLKQTTSKGSKRSQAN